MFIYIHTRSYYNRCIYHQYPYLNGQYQKAVVIAGATIYNFNHEIRNNESDFKTFWLHEIFIPYLYSFQLILFSFF
jgi:hypothetical protein